MTSKATSKAIKKVRKAITLLNEAVDDIEDAEISSAVDEYADNLHDMICELESEEDDEE